MKKIISFVLWGDKPIYNQGAIENVKESYAFYSDWICRIYCSPKSPAYATLLNMKCEVVPVDFESDSWTNLFIRYKPATEDDVDISIFRDADSRLNSKEKAAVDEWMQSDKALHYMKDDAFHFRWPVNSGMWGIKKGYLKDFYTLSDEWLKNKNAGNVKNKAAAIDEWFISEVIWPKFKDNCMGHIGSGIFNQFTPTYGPNEKPFPKHEPMKWGHYVGATIPIMGERNKVSVFRFQKK